MQFQNAQEKVGNKEGRIENLRNAIRWKPVEEKVLRNHGSQLLNMTVRPRKDDDSIQTIEFS